MPVATRQVLWRRSRLYQSLGSIPRQRPTGCGGDVILLSVVAYILVSLMIENSPELAHFDMRQAKDSCYESFSPPPTILCCSNSIIQQWGSVYLRYSVILNDYSKVQMMTYCLPKVARLIARISVRSLTGGISLRSTWA